MKGKESTMSLRFRAESAGRIQVPGTDEERAGRSKVRGGKCLQVPDCVSLQGPAALCWLA